MPQYPQVPCPYIQPGSPRGLVCTGEEHLIAGTQSRKACPLVLEARTWANHLGVRGSAPHLLETFTRAYQPSAFLAVSRWVQNPTGILILAAQPGRGKSRLALGAWYALRRQRKSCILVSATQFAQLAALWASGRDEGGAMERIIGQNLLLLPRDRVMDPSLVATAGDPVVFDDLGSERTTDTVRECIRTMLAHRQNVMITTNLDETALEPVLGERVMSRLSTATWVWMGGEDRRQEFDGVCGCTDE